MSRKNEEELVSELSISLERNVDEIRSQWIEQMQKAGVLGALSQREIDEQSRAIYNACLQCLKTGSYEAAENYATNMAKRAVLAAMTVDQIITGLLILRDVYGHFIFRQYQENPEKWRAIIGVYEPVARRILNIVALAFVAERESTIKQQQEDMVRLLSTPLVEIWEGMVMLPLIGFLDSERARQLTESILNHIARTRTDTVLIDVSGITAVDTKTANYLLRTIQAVRLMGSDAIITGIGPEVATTLVTLGVDLSAIRTRSTLREGLEDAYKRLGLTITKLPTS